MRQENKRLYAPYVYLAGDGKIFDLFILTPISTGEHLKITPESTGFKNPNYGVKETDVNLEITNQGQNASGGYSWLHVTLNPEDKYLSFNEKTYLINVFIKDPTGTQHQVSLVYGDREASRITNTDLVLNAPYAYLAEPKGTPTTGILWPFVIIPVKDQKTHTTEVETTQPVKAVNPPPYNGPNAVTEFYLEMVGGNPPLSFILPAVTNAHSYQDINMSIHNYFLINVNYATTFGITTDKKRKAKIRNKNADDKPSPFSN